MSLKIANKGDGVDLIYLGFRKTLNLVLHDILIKN